jgi:RNA polymerase sigma-70 factor (ECF subfamily)
MGDDVTAIAQAGSVERADARELYARYYPAVYGYLLSRLRSREDAEDAAQNTFLRAFAALQRGVVPESETAWLFAIAHNVCLSSRLAWVRRRRVEAPHDLDELVVAAPESRREELTGLEDALAAMPPRLRQAFLLREWQGLSYAEIAAELDTSRSAVETLIFRARRLLAKELQVAVSVGPLVVRWLRRLLEAAPAGAKAGVAVVAVAGGVTVAAVRPAPVEDRAPTEAPPSARAPAPAVVGETAKPPAAAQPRAAARPVVLLPPVLGALPPATEARPADPEGSTPAPDRPVELPELPSKVTDPLPVLPPLSEPVVPLPKLPTLPETPQLPLEPQLPAKPELPPAPEVPPLEVPTLPSLP